MKLSKGFTLIELMVVVGIIGILVAVAIPAYSRYQAEAKLTASLADISPAKTEFELTLINGGAINSVNDLTSIVSPQTPNCVISASNNSISCQVINAPTIISNTQVNWIRDAATETWSCFVSGLSAGNADLAPSSCPAS